LLILFWLVSWSEDNAGPI